MLLRQDVTSLYVNVKNKRKETWILLIAVQNVSIRNVKFSKRKRYITKTVKDCKLGEMEIFQN